MKRFSSVAVMIGAIILAAGAFGQTQTLSLDSLKAKPLSWWSALMDSNGVLMPEVEKTVREKITAEYGSVGDIRVVKSQYGYEENASILCDFQGLKEVDICLIPAKSLKYLYRMERLAVAAGLTAVRLNIDYPFCLELYLSDGQTTFMVGFRNYGDHNPEHCWSLAWSTDANVMAEFRLLKELAAWAQRQGGKLARILPEGNGDCYVEVSHPLSPFIPDDADVENNNFSFYIRSDGRIKSGYEHSYSFVRHEVERAGHFKNIDIAWIKEVHNFVPVSKELVEKWKNGDVSYLEQRGFFMTAKAVKEKNIIAAWNHAAQIQDKKEYIKVKNVLHNWVFALYPIASRSSAFDSSDAGWFKQYIPTRLDEQVFLLDRIREGDTHGVVNWWMAGTTAYIYSRLAKYQTLNWMQWKEYFWSRLWLTDNLDDYYDGRRGYSLPSDIYAKRALKYLAQVLDVLSSSSYAGIIPAEFKKNLWEMMKYMRWRANDMKDYLQKCGCPPTQLRAYSGQIDGKIFLIGREIERITK